MSYYDGFEEREGKMVEIASVFASAKIAYDIAKGINSLNSDVEIKQAVSKVLETLLSVQSDALTKQQELSLFIKEKDNLEKKLMEFENWEKTASQYKLVSMGIGNLVYVTNDVSQSTVPKHYICPNCYEKRKRSILQPTRDDDYWFNTKCLEHDCNFSLSVKRRDEYDAIRSSRGEF
jgi:hypothetical protein